MMNLDCFINYPHGPFLDDVSIIDEGFVDGLEPSDTSSLPDLEDIFIPGPHGRGEDDKGDIHITNDGGDVVVIDIDICIVIVISIGIAFNMMLQKWVRI